MILHAGNSIVNGLFVFALFTIWLLLLYHVLLTWGGYRHFLRMLAAGDDPPDSAPAPWPRVSILVPAHNEEAVIGRTIDALARLIYPKDRIEIIVVDDASTDGTGDILRGKCRVYPQLRIVTTDRENGGKGKSRALNTGLESCGGEYVVVYDADNTPERRAVLRLVNAITKDEGLGAVVGKFRTRNRNASWLTRFVNIETLSFQWLMQASRCHFFGLTTIPGTNYIIRRSLLQRLGGWNDRALTEDTELTVRIYDSGCRISWLPHSVTWEQEPETLRVWLKQRTRWAQGNMWMVAYYLARLQKLRDMRIVADILYFCLVYFVFFVAAVLSDLIFVLGALGLVKVTLSGPFLPIWFLAYVLFVAETYMSLSLERGEGTAGNFLITCVMYFTYCQLWLIVIFLALWKSARDGVSGKKEPRWYKTERSSG